MSLIVKLDGSCLSVFSVKKTYFMGLQKPSCFLPAFATVSAQQSYPGSTVERVQRLGLSVTVFPTVRTDLPASL